MCRVNRWPDTDGHRAGPECKWGGQKARPDPEPPDELNLRGTHHAAPATTQRKSLPLMLNTTRLLPTKVALTNAALMSCGVFHFDALATWCHHGAIQNQPCDQKRGFIVGAGTRSITD